MPVCCCSLAGTAACLTCPNRTVLPNPAMWHEVNVAPQKGWECPVCGMVMAPWMPTCTRCPVQTTWATSAEPPAPPKEATQIEVGKWECAYCGKDCRQNICIGRANALYRKEG